MKKVRKALFIVSVSLLFTACSKQEEAPPPDRSTPSVEQNASPGIGSADMTATLAELTQVVRKYGMEKQKVPKDLNELVAAGYIPQVPAAPAGKKFAIDAKMQVYLADN